MTSSRPEELRTEKETSSGDRRTNLVLRALIDEMLDRVRDINRHSTTWTSTDRSRAEGELDAIMARVRRVASLRGTRTED